ncbi:MAG TPA: DUF3108 domain-containing protein [Ramlibacter sp.]|nr:DUF3108 domain-containing protein [Ramlibacter sp.]
MARRHAGLSSPVAAPAALRASASSRRQAGGRAARLALIAALVLVVHALALEWITRQAMTEASALRQVIDPMFTRVIMPTTPPEAPPQAQTAAVEAAAGPRRPTVSLLPEPPASAPQAAPEPAQAAAPALPAASAPQPDVVASAPGDASAAPARDASSADAQQPQAPASGDAAPTGDAHPAPAASAPGEAAAPAPAAAASSAGADSGSAATAPAASLDTWPVDTRLNYVLAGEFRGGALYGSARVQWQRQGPLYQTRLEIDVSLAPTRVMTSQGDVTPRGLAPRAFEETYGKNRRTVRLNDAEIVMSDGRVVPRPDGVQDTASQFVELGHRFATGREKLAVGQAVNIWLARPNGVDLWVYDVTEREMLRTPRYGEVEAFRLRPRAIAKPRGNITAEIWYAPSLQYLPVRIRVSMGSEAYVDLMVDTVQQR